MKKRPFFNEFDFDQLNDFKLSPPYTPPSVDLSQYLMNTDTPYEDIVAQDNYVGSKKDKEDYCPAGYDRHWADEF